MKIRARKFKSRSGISTVEFALLLPLLAVLLLAIVEFSLALYDKAVIVNASREGARLAASFRIHSDGSPDAVTTDEVKTKVGNCTTNLVCFRVSDHPENTLATKVEYRTPPEESFKAWPNSASHERGEDLKVTVTYKYYFLVLSGLGKVLSEDSLPDYMTLEAVTIMRAEW